MPQVQHGAPSAQPEVNILRIAIYFHYWKRLLKVISLPLSLLCIFTHQNWAWHPRMIKICQGGESLLTCNSSRYSHPHFSSGQLWPKHAPYPPLSHPHHLTLQHFQEALSSTQIHRWTPQPPGCHPCIWLTAVCRLDPCGGLFAGASASALSPAAYAQHGSQGSCWNVPLRQVIPLLRNISQASHLTQGQAEGIPMEPALPDSAPNYSSKTISTLLHPLTLFLPHRPLC